MTKKRIIWGLIAALAFYIFYAAIPIDLLHSFPLFWIILGVILFVVPAVQCICLFKDWDDFKTQAKEDQDWRHRAAPFLLIMGGIASAFTFYMHYESRKMEKVKQKGIVVTATITNGYQKRSRRSTMYYLEYAFTTKDGKYIKVEQSVGSEDYRAVGIGSHVDVMYDSTNPGMFEPITNASNIEALTGHPDRELRMMDLNFIAQHSLSDDSITNYLNGINYKWELKKTDSLRMWYNEKKALALLIKSKGNVSLVTYSLQNAEPLRHDLQKAPYSLLLKDSINKTNYYKAADHLASFSSKLEIDTGERSLGGYKMVTVIRVEATGK